MSSLRGGLPSGHQEIVKTPAAIHRRGTNPRAGSARAPSSARSGSMLAAVERRAAPGDELLGERHAAGAGGSGAQDRRERAAGRRRRPRRRRTSKTGPGTAGRARVVRGLREHALERSRASVGARLLGEQWGRRSRSTGASGTPRGRRRSARMPPSGRARAGRAPRRRVPPVRRRPPATPVQAHATPLALRGERRGEQHGDREAPKTLQLVAVAQDARERVLRTEEGGWLHVHVIGQTVLALQS